MTSVEKYSNGIQFWKETAKTDIQEIKNSDSHIAVKFLGLTINYFYYVMMFVPAVATYYIYKAGLKLRNFLR